MGVGNDAVQMIETLPHELTPVAEAFVKRVISCAAMTARPPSFRDTWVAIMHKGGMVRRVLEELSIDNKELYQRVSGL